jgi:cytoskeletal protein RodZ
MPATWTLGEVDSGVIKLIIFVIVIVFYAVKMLARRSKEQAEERARTSPKPKSAPETGSPVSPPERAAAASAPEKKTAASEVDRFLEQLARQSGVPVPQRPPAPPRPKPPVVTPPPAPRAPAPVARPHAPVAVHRAQTPQPQPAEMTMVEAMALPVETEPVAGLPDLSHFSPLAQAIVLREILGPCRALRPHRSRPRSW